MWQVLLAASIPFFLTALLPPPYSSYFLRISMLELGFVILYLGYRTKKYEKALMEAISGERDREEATASSG